MEKKIKILKVTPTLLYSQLQEYDFMFKYQWGNIVLN